MSSLRKREPRLLGEVIRDLIERGEILPNYKLKGYEYELYNISAS